MVKMKLIKICDMNNIQCYKICEPSKEFIKKYPKKIIYCFRNQDDDAFSGNEDKIPITYIYLKLRGYIFSYSDIDLSKIFKNVHRSDEAIIPCIDNLDKYIKSDKDVVIRYNHKVYSPPQFVSDAIIIDTTVDTILNKSAKDLEKNFNDSLTNCLKIYTVEEWVEKIFHNVPLTFDGFCVKYPDKITNKSLKQKKYSIKDFVVSYDMRVSSQKVEFDIAKKIDELHVPDDYEIEIYRDEYCGLIKRIEKALTSKPISEDDEKIVITFKQYKNLKNMKFTLLDCF